MCMDQQAECHVSTCGHCTYHLPVAATFSTALYACPCLVPTVIILDFCDWGSLTRAIQKGLFKQVCRGSSSWYARGRVGWGVGVCGVG
jgi:hypothetical protein